MAGKSQNIEWTVQDEKQGETELHKDKNLA